MLKIDTYIKYVLINQLFKLTFLNFYKIPQFFRKNTLFNMVN